MIRNLKMLGLALAAMLVLGAAAAQGAFAATMFTTDPPTEHVTLTSKADPTEPTQSFTAAGHTITCSEANFSAMADSETGTTEEATFSGNYGGCEFLGVNVNVSMGACDFVFHASGKVDVAGGSNCAVGKEPITFKASALGGLVTCHVEIGAQEGLGTVTFTNTNTTGTTTGQEITADVNIEGIKYTSKGTGGGCESLTNATNGKYVGHETVTGEETGTTNMVGILAS